MNNRNELKSQALLERVSQLSTQYENQLADYRVEMTMLASQKQELESEIGQLREEVARLNESVPVADVVEGEVLPNDAD